MAFLNLSMLINFNFSVLVIILFKDFYLLVTVIVNFFFPILVSIALVSVSLLLSL